MSTIQTIVAFVLAPALVVGATAPGASDAPWSWPVTGDRVVLRPFIAPETPYGPGHRGVDLLVTGDDLLAPADGTVRFAGMVAGRPVVSIDHGDGVISSSEPVVASVATGATVRRGETIGTVVDGHCQQRCVHFGIRVDGEYANPLRWLGGGVQPILLPTRFPGSAGVTAPSGPRRRPRARAPATRTAPPRSSRAMAR